MGPRPGGLVDNIGRAELARRLGHNWHAKAGGDQVHDRGDLGMVWPSRGLNPARRQASDNTYSTLLTLTVQQVHFDAAYAAHTEWKKMLADSNFTLALLTGMSVRTVSAKVVADLGWNKVKATHPVFAGDPLRRDHHPGQAREQEPAYARHCHRLHVGAEPGRQGGRWRQHHKHPQDAERRQDRPHLRHGQKAMYDFLDDNPSVETWPVDCVATPLVIAQNEGVVLINDTIGIDLTAGGLRPFNVAVWMACPRRTSAARAGVLKA